MWMALDPLTTWDTSVATYIHSDTLWCRPGRHEENCHCEVLERHYGRRPFKYSFLGCSSFRHGFVTRSSRNSHEKHHDRPWKCAVPSCEYAEIGFLSRRMRDGHRHSDHQEVELTATDVSKNFHEDDMQPLLFDLISLDKVEAVRKVLSASSRLSAAVEEELMSLAATSGSASMVELLYHSFKFVYVKSSYLIDSMRGMNLETLKWFLSQTKTMTDLMKSNFNSFQFPTQFLKAVIESDSMEIYRECEKYIVDYMVQKRAISFAFLATAIRATAQNTGREIYLLCLWTAATSSRLEKPPHYALGEVAESTCSVVLAKSLMNYGADVDSMLNDRKGKGGVYLTPLQRAARKSSPEAAKMVKFLLYQGANPEVWGGRPSIQVSEEKGAKGIAKWLDMSWDELVEKVRIDRKNGICPPEYRLDV